MNAYRSPGWTTPARRKERLALLRYPRWAQAAVLPWLPMLAAAYFFAVPRGQTLVCAEGGCVLESQTRSTSER